jgi:hypothetical protein
MQQPIRCQPPNLHPVLTAAHTLFIPRDQAPQLRAQLANYKSLRRSTDQWIRLAIQIARMKRKLKP